MTFRALMVLVVVATPFVASARTVIFMNRSGGVFDPAPSDDSRANRSSLIARTSVIPRFAGGDAQWTSIMGCMRTLFAPFDVEITDVDPGEAPHLESVTGGHPEDAGFPSNYGGVGTLAPCGSTVSNAVVFTFSDAWLGDAQLICEAAAQEIGHTFGLDHVRSCPDPMSYQYGCGDKQFLDEESACGEYSARACRCGGATQNGYQVLRGLLGERQAPRAEPIVGSPEEAVFAQEGKGDRVAGRGAAGCSAAGRAPSGVLALLLLALVATWRCRVGRPNR